jgi:hypothetical protein
LGVLAEGLHVKLLHAIYSSPTQLLSKARSDGALLVSALRDQDEEAVRGALFNFAVTTYHVWDWVKTYRADLDADATNPLRKHAAILAMQASMPAWT